MKKIYPLLLTGMCLIFSMQVQAKDNKDAKESKDSEKQTSHILIVGLDENVKSNYYYNGMIAEETGIEADYIDQEFNRIISENIAISNKDKNCRFTSADPEQINGQLLQSIKVNGESEECYSDISSVSSDEWQNTFEKMNADYMLILNQHYLKWQEVPLRTLFHIVSYTVFDKDKKEICRGNQYFTCMHLENSEKQRKISLKSTSKIASNVIKSLKEN